MNKLTGWVQQFFEKLLIKPNDEFKTLKHENELLQKKYDELQSHEGKFRTLLELAPDAFFQGDSKGNFITVNDKTVELTEYSRDELLSMNMSDLFPKTILQDKPLRYDLLTIGQTIKIEREIQTKMGKRIQVEMSSKAMPDGTYQSLMRNITERKQAQDAIQKSETRLTRAELASNSGNWELHLDTQIMIGSKGALKLYGVDKEQFDYEFVKKIPLPEYRDMLNTALKDLLENNKPYDLEFKIKAVDTGEIKDIHSIAFYDKEIRILFGIIQDITDNKRAEAELIKAKEMALESDRLKTVFLQNMSHEIRTPMNAIMGFSDLLPGYFNDKEKLIEFTSIIQSRSSDLLELINDILDLSKIETGQVLIHMEECDLSEIFKELHIFFKNYQEKIKKTHIDLQFISGCSPASMVITIDKGKLKQIFINLIYNAFKFTDEGIITFGCNIHVNKFTFFVADTGCGIPYDKQAVVFDRFMQLGTSCNKTQQGTGLGLSIVKGLVELLGGSITLTSEVGRGSTFNFTVNYQTVDSI